VGESDSSLARLNSSVHVQLEGSANMELLAFTTDKMSWAFLMSALRHMQADEGMDSSVDLNLEAPPCVVLSCVAVEAFVNELSSLTNSFLFERAGTDYAGRSNPKQALHAVASGTLKEVARIRCDGHDSFYVRYKRLLCVFGLDKPRLLADLSVLGKARDALVHFRKCDVPIIQDQNGVIRVGQDLPAEIAALQSQYYGGRCVLAPAPGEGQEWTLRMETDAMAAWSVNLALDAILFVLDHLPAGEHRDFVWKSYANRDSTFSTLFARGKNELETWWHTIVRPNHDTEP